MTAYFSLMIQNRLMFIVCYNCRTSPSFQCLSHMCPYFRIQTHSHNLSIHRQTSSTLSSHPMRMFAWLRCLADTRPSCQIRPPLGAYHAELHTTLIGGYGLSIKVSNQTIIQRESKDPNADVLNYLVALDPFLPLFCPFFFSSPHSFLLSSGKVFLEGRVPEEKEEEDAAREVRNGEGGHRRS